MGDRELIASLRDGHRGAADELWRRHSSAARSYAWTFRNLADADDLVSEAFIRAYAKIQSGGGPEGAFRPYLLTIVRNTALSWGRSRSREIDLDELDSLPGSESAEHEAFRNLENSTTLRAFRSLPSRWQEALWYSEVEALPREEVARLLGLTANAVSQLTFRAREGLRTAWVTQQLRSKDLPPDCATVFPSIAGYARGTVSKRDREKVLAHVRTCTRCMILVEEAENLSARIGFVLIPVLLGVSSSVYLSLSPSGMSVAAATTFTPPAEGASAPLDAALFATGSSTAAGAAPGWTAPAVIAGGSAAAIGIAVAMVVAVGDLPSPQPPPPSSAVISSTPPVPDHTPAPPPTPSPAPPAPSAPVRTTPIPSAPVPTTPIPSVPATAESTPAAAAPPRTTTPLDSTPEAPAPLASPSVLWDVDPDGWLLPQASGTALPSARVQILDDERVVWEMTADLDGNWEAHNIPLEVGTHLLSANQITPAGIESATSTLLVAAVRSPEVSVERLNNLGKLSIAVPDGLGLMLVEENGCRVLGPAGSRGKGTIVHCTDLTADATVTFCLVGTGAQQGRLGPQVQVVLPAESLAAPSPSDP